jgi:hypothetical protein
MRTLNLICAVEGRAYFSRCPKLIRAFLAFIFGICLIVAAAALAPSNDVIIMLPHKHNQTTLTTLNLSANSFTVGSAPGTFIGNVMNTATGSTVTFDSLSVANSLQLANILSGAFNTPHTTSGFAVNENAVTAFNPSNPAASGYALVFDDEFNSPNTIDINNTEAPGYNWYPGNFFGSATPASMIQVANGALTLLSSNNNISLGLSTAGPANNADGFVGQAFGGGAYYEARVKFNPANVNPSTTNWPSFWAYAIEVLLNNSRWNAQWPGQAAGYNHFVEDDFFEYDLGTTGAYNGAIHDWYGKINQCGGGWQARGPENNSLLDRRRF